MNKKTWQELREAQKNHRYESMLMQDIFNLLNNDKKDGTELLQWLLDNSNQLTKSTQFVLSALIASGSE